MGDGLTTEVGLAQGRRLSYSLNSRKLSFSGTGFGRVIGREPISQPTPGKEVKPPVDQPSRLWSRRAQQGSRALPVHHPGPVLQAIGCLFWLDARPTAVLQ